VILIDTSGLLAALGHDVRAYKEARAAYEDDSGPAILSPFVLAELDYMLLTRAGVKAELELLREVATGVFRLAEFGPRDVAHAVTVAEQYQDLRIGLADASIVVLAERYDTTRVLTLDERHFRAMKPRHAASFTLLPADAGGS
jgi:predicted nucleic acid-binding protein